jgi:hypothetical protein
MKFSFYVISAHTKAFGNNFSFLQYQNTAELRKIKLNAFIQASLPCHPWQMVK